MSESTQVEKVDQQQQVTNSNRTPEMTTVQEFISRNASTMVKLSVFSAALFAFPIVTFFCTLHSLFDGNTTYAAIAAAAMANVIVLLYIITAFLEKPREDKKDEKKDQ